MSAQSDKPTAPDPAQIIKDATELAGSLKEAMEHGAKLEGQLAEKSAALEAKDKELAAKDREIAQLKAAQAEKPEPVELQKVAFDEDQLSSTLDTLVGRELISEDDREKFASKLQGNPNAALHVINQIATLQHNLPASEPGVGIPKEAGEKTAANADPKDGGFGSAEGWLAQ